MKDKIIDSMKKGIGSIRNEIVSPEGTPNGLDYTNIVDTSPDLKKDSTVTVNKKETKTEKPADKQEKGDKIFANKFYATKLNKDAENPQGTIPKKKEANKNKKGATLKAEKVGIIPKTPEEEELYDAREEYFRAKRAAKFNSKYKSEDPTKPTFYEDDLAKAEKSYKALRNRTIEDCLAKGEAGKAEAQEFLLKEVELKRKHDLENGFARRGERMMHGVSKGIEMWDNFGKAEGFKGDVQRFTKTAISLAMIGAISGFAVHKLAELGIGTASALGGGLTSYMGRRMGVGLGLSAIMAKIPDDKKKWINYTLIAGSAGLAVFGGGALAGLAVVGSSVVGLGVARLAKGYNKKIESRIAKVQKGEIDLNRLDEMEKEKEIVLKKAEMTRTLGKLGEVLLALMVSMGTLEMAGLVHDHNQHTTDTNHPQTDQKHVDDTKQQHPAEQKNVAGDKEVVATPKNEAAGAHPGAVVSNATETAHPTISIIFEHGHGAIRGFQDFQHKLHELYPDPEKAPSNLRHFMDTKPEELAKEYKFFHPGDQNDSALIHKGAIMQLDDHNNVSFQDPKTGETDILSHGDNSQAGHFSGTMKETHHNEAVNNTTKINTEKSFIDLNKTYFDKSNHIDTLNNADVNQPLNTEHLTHFDKDHHLDASEARAKVVAAMDASPKHEGSINISGTKFVEATENGKNILVHQQAGDPWVIKIYPDEHVAKFYDTEGNLLESQSISNEHPLSAENIGEMRLKLSHFNENNFGKYNYLPEELKKDINFVFGTHIHNHGEVLKAWESVRDLKASAILKSTEHHTPISDTKDHLLHIKELCEKATGEKFNPKPGFFGMGRESAEHYWGRGLKILESKKIKV
jgi:hypothetical protein